MPFLIRFMLFAAITLAVGLGSAWRMIDTGFFATTRTFGPWSTWINEGVAGADPYTEAHFARVGALPATSASSLTFTAAGDGSRSPLRGNCTYDIDGYAFPALWWSMAAFTPDGRSVETKAGRASINSGNVIAGGDGHFVLRLSPDLQPGNWLPSERGSRVVLHLTILRAASPDRLLQSPAEFFPTIKLVECS